MAIPRQWLWVGGAVVVALVWLWMRSRAASGQEQPEVGAPGADTGGGALPGIGQALAATDTTGQAAYQAALQDLELKATGAELQFRTGQLGRQSTLEQAQLGQQLQMIGFATGQTRLPASFQCPRGKPRIDPVTGQLYCRERTGGGVFRGFNLGKLVDAFRNFYPRALPPNARR